MNHIQSDILRNGVDSVLMNIPPDELDLFIDGHNKDLAMIIAVNGTNDSFEYLQKYCGDQDIVLASISKSLDIWKYVAPGLKNNTKFICKAITANYKLYNILPYKIRIKKCVTRSAVEINTSVWQYIPDKLKYDKSIVLAAVLRDGLILRDVPEVMLDNYAITYAAIKSNGLALQYVLNCHKEDRDIVFMAVEQNGMTLQYVLDCHKEDRDIVLMAVKQNGMALQYAADKFKHDREVVKSAVCRRGTALQFAPAFYGDKKMVFLSLLQIGYSDTVFIYKSMPDHIKNDKLIRLAIIRSYGVNCLMNIDWPVTRDDVIEAIKKYRLYPDDLGIYLLDPEVMVLAISNNRLANWEIDLSLLSNPQVIDAACDLYYFASFRVERIVRVYKILIRQIPKYIAHDWVMLMI